MTSRAIGGRAVAIGLILASWGGTARAGGPSWEASPRAERREARWRKNPAAAIPEMVEEICRAGESDGTATELLLQAGAPAVAPLLAAFQPNGDCRGEPATLVAEIVCEAQAGTDVRRVTGAFAPVRAALGSTDWRRVEAALSVIDQIGDPPPDTPTPGSLGSSRRSNAFECVAPAALLDASAAPLGRLLERTSGPRRERVAAAVSSLGTRAAPLVPVLSRLLDEEDAQLEAVTALGAIGPAAATAAPALAKLLTRAEDAERRLRIARALATMGPRAAEALPALRARLAQAAANPCARGRELPWLIFAVLSLGPGHGESIDGWTSTMAAEIGRGIRAVRSCDAAETEAQLIKLVAALSCAHAAEPLIEVMMDEGRSLARRTPAAEALVPLNCTLPAPEAATQKLLVDRERQRLGVVSEGQGAQLPTHSGAASASLQRAVAQCDAEAARTPPQSRLDSGQPEHDFAMARCLQDRLCGPGPERGARAMSVCCRYAYGRAAPPWCAR